jgi:hypothetical protein
MTSCGVMAFSINYPYDAQGEPDTRPGCWGDAGYNDGPVQFLDVPAGHRVRIVRVYGDFVAWPMGDPAEGKFAGILFGLLATDNGASPYATLSAKGCPLYLQNVVGKDGVRGSFDVECSAAGLLGPDHVMLVRRAIFLNELGCSVHQEPSFVVEFEYVPEETV